VAGPKGVEPLSMVPETIVLSIELQALNAVRKASQTGDQVKPQNLELCGEGGRPEKDGSG
jgi:hypothetical protein